VVCGSAFAWLDAAAHAQTFPENPPETLLLFAGADLWRAGGFAHGGFVWSPGGLDKEGFTAKLMAGAGTYRYRSGNTPIKGDVLVFDVMPGWRFKPGSADIAVFAGLDIQNHRLSPDDPSNRARGTHAGLRLGLDFWWEPTPGTMTNAGLSFATIGTGYWARAAYGWRAFDNFYIGPEALALGDDTYRQWRVGAHVTALRTGVFDWSVGTGYVSDSDHRSGLYGRIGVLTRR
jgi:hypothetical protein